MDNVLRDAAAFETNEMSDSADSAIIYEGASKSVRPPFTYRGEQLYRSVFNEGA